MAYKALYRKWRPVVFDDVIGQSHITKTLKNEIKENRIAHAYLFTGTRGTGKTSTAKIFSRAVNCENPKDGNPCNECATCKSILNDTVLDIIEIDAASNTGVDNIRSVIEQVQYAPTVGKYKVYIIDEVHMLSGGAFNALLKTLEEPPEYVVFILATTETHRVPATILSRCQRFDFKTISVDDIAERINYILKEENLNVSDEAVRYIAYLGQGSMRDSLSILEQCLAFGGDKLSYDDVVNILGSVDDTVYYEIAKKISANDVKGVIETFENLVNNGKNLDNFAPCLLDVIRQLLISKISEGKIKPSYSEEKNKIIEKISHDFTADKLLSCTDVISELVSDLKYNSMQRVLIEVALVKMASDEENSLRARVEKLEKMLSGTNIPNVAYNTLSTKPVAKESKDSIKNEQISAEDKSSALKSGKPAGNAKENINETESVAEHKEESFKNDIIKGSDSPNLIDKVVANWKSVVENVFASGGLKLYSAIYSAKPVKNENVLCLMCDDYNKSQILTESKKEIAGVIKKLFSADIAISVNDTVVEKTDKNNGDLFGNLSDLSNKYPNNFNMS